MNSAMKGVSFLVSGLGIGWLVGLSSSPVVAAVIAALLAALVTLASGDRTEDGVAKHLRVAASAMALLVLGVAVGATAGLAYRTGSWGQARPAQAPRDLQAIVREWTSLGVEKHEVVKRLLDQEFSGAVPAAAAAGGEPLPTGLVSMSTKECEGVRAAAPDKILSELAGSPRPAIRDLGRQALELKLSDAFAETLREALCQDP